MQTVAVCTASPALTAILSSVLAGRAGLRIRQFESEAGLTSYMRLAPVALLVCDLERAEMVAAIRHDQQLAERNLDVIALSRTLNLAERQLATAAGIDEVLLKPMTPTYLLERVVARLERRAARLALASPGNERRPRPTQAWPVPTPRFSGNVVPLFPKSWQPNP